MLTIYVRMRKIVESLNTYLNPHHHVEVPLTVLFYHVPHVIRLSGLLKFSPRHEILDFSDGSYCIFVCFCQPKIEFRTHFLLRHRVITLWDVCYDLTF